MPCKSAAPGASMLQGEELEPPRFVKELEDTSVPDGETTVFTCQVTGRPTPEISWFCEEQCIDMMPEFVVNYDRSTGYIQLVNKETFPEDKGVYRCHASNIAGTADTVAELIVITPIRETRSETVEETTTTQVTETIEIAPKEGPQEPESSEVQLEIAMPQMQAPHEITVAEIAPQQPETQESVSQFKVQQTVEIQSVEQVQAPEEQPEPVTELVELDMTETEEIKKEPEKPKETPEITTVIAAEETDVEPTELKRETLYYEETIVEPTELKTPTILYIIFEVEPPELKEEIVNYVESETEPPELKAPVYHMITMELEAPELRGPDEIRSEPVIEEETETQTTHTTQIITQVEARAPEQPEFKEIQIEFPMGEDIPQVVSQEVTREETEVTEITDLAPQPLEPKQTEIVTKQISVSEPPKFIEPIQPQVVKEKETCTFTAFISGEPAPEVTWTKEGQPLMPPEEYNVEHVVEEQKYTLTMPEVTEEKQGTYACQASNPAGRATSTANLVVVRKCWINIYIGVL